VDALGQVFVADFYNHRIQVFTDEGDFLVELGSQGSAPGEFERPTDMTVDSQGNIYVVDFGNNRIQKFAPLTSQTKHD
jgi:DNA-binding beta-propeller fold protein YncE